jgi:phenylpropionate dioxygenase-like ring-hydroxylating dioxygenase large terminal subunit
MSNRADVMELKEHWYIAATAAELRSRPVSRTVLGERLVLFRQADGHPAALLDRCAHRNMALSHGQVREGCVECPYHGWRYRGDGLCVDIPSLRGGATTPPSIAVRAFPTVESDGFVWVYMGETTADRRPGGGPSARPADGEPGAVGGRRSAVTSPFRFPHYREPGWTSFLMVTRFRAGAMACLENFLDCPHTVYVHQGWFRSRDAKEVCARVTRGADRVEVEFFGERDAKSVISRLLFPSGQKLVHTDRFFMPATTRVDYSFGPDRHFIITSQCTPVSAGETMVYTVITFRFGRLGPLVRLIFEPIARRIIRQDAEILAVQTEQLRQFGGPRFTFVETDLIGPHIWKLWQRALAGQSVEATEASPDEPAEVEQEVVLRF